MKYTVVLIVVLWQITACHKSELLKEKQGTAIIVPATPGDMQALLDNEDVFGPTTSLNFICADEFYFAEAAFADMKQSTVSAYLHKDFLFDKEEEVSDWNNGYTQAYYANNVLEGVERLRGGIDDKILNPLEGDAYFKRSYAFFNVAQVFALPYDSLTAADDPGIALRLTTKQDEVLARSSVAATYKMIIDDLRTAVPLLPPTIELLHRNRSSRPAAYALLARVYMSMSAYAEALDAAKRSLDLYDSLINFNTGLVSSGTPFSATNAETLYQSTVSNADALYEKMALREVFVDSTLLTEYKVGDLRRTVFFSKSSPATFKPGYYGKSTPFTGLGIAELYLIVSECYARQGDVNTAMFYLNELLKSRWKTGQYIPYTATTPEEALNVILQERRKELVFRGLRYTDVRRLNKKQPLLTLSRTMQGNTYMLSPNSPRYALPIPAQVLWFNNHIDQNEY
jgi:starch-binding outer membrane protein, SusD/RagB family